MFCPYCQTAIINNDVRCPSCGGYLSMQGNEPNKWWGGPEQAQDGQMKPPQAGQWTYGASQQQQWQNPVSLPLQGQQQSWQWQQSVSQPPEKSQLLWQWQDGEESTQAQKQQPWRNPSAPLGPQGQPHLWEQSPVQNSQQQVQQREPAMLPVPYQGGMQLQTAVAANGTQMIPIQMVEQMLPALPEAEGGMIYVPPMYTKPRAIITKYRAISGLLSIFIVALLVCSGASYFANASGLLYHISIASGLALPASLKPTSIPILPTPPPNIAGQPPASDIIPSAALTANIDPVTNVARQAENKFGINQKFYLAYSIHTLNNDGKVITKWYTNNNPFKIISSDTVAAGSSKNGALAMKYVAPTSGKVEIWWSDKTGQQLAQTLFFVVE